MTGEPEHVKGTQMSHDLSKKKHIQNGHVVVPTRVEIHMSGNLDMCRDHRRLTTCQKQHRQNESAGQLDTPGRVKVHATGDFGHI